MPLPDQAQAGILASAFRQYRSLPADLWSEITLSDGDIVGLVNLRVLAQTLRLSPEDVLREARGEPWYELYARLIRDVDGREDGV